MKTSFFNSTLTSIDLPDLTLEGFLNIPEESTSLVIFVHGSGSSKQSPRNIKVSQQLYEAGHGTLLFDLLTTEEEIEDRYNGFLRFDIPFLAKRLTDVTFWAKNKLEDFNLGYFGASTGAAAALMAAAEAEDFFINAIVSRGGRPDLALHIIPKVKSPTLFIVGENDSSVIDLNQTAYDRLTTEKKLEIIPGASHLFEEPGTLDKAAKLAIEWFDQYL